MPMRSRPIHSGDFAIAASTARSTGWHSGSALTPNSVRKPRPPTSRNQSLATAMRRSASATGTQVTLVPEEFASKYWWKSKAKLCPGSLKPFSASAFDCSPTRLRHECAPDQLVPGTSTRLVAPVPRMASTARAAMPAQSPVPMRTGSFIRPKMTRGLDR